MNKQNLEFLFDIYQKVNNETGDSINFSEYKIDDEIEEKPLKYNFQEDVINEIYEDIDTFNKAVDELKNIDMSNSLNNLVQNKKFLLSFIEISSKLSSLTHELEEFNNMHIEIMKKFPINE